MTDNMFEVKTNTLAHVPCATRDSGILLTDFACELPLEKAELPVFIRQFYSNSMTEVAFAWKAGGQFLMAKGVRQGCPASGF